MIKTRPRHSHIGHQQPDRKIKSRDNSPSSGGFHKTGDEVEVYCRIRHVDGIVTSDSSDSESEQIDSNRLAACKAVDQKTVALSTIDKRNNKVETTTHYSRGGDQSPEF